MFSSFLESVHPLIAGCKVDNNCCAAESGNELCYTHNAAGDESIPAYPQNPRYPSESRQQKIFESPEQPWAIGGIKQGGAPEHEFYESDGHGYASVNDVGMPIRGISSGDVEYQASQNYEFTTDMPNAMAQWLWPSITEFVENMILSVIEPSIKAALVNAMGKSQTLVNIGSSFAFDRNRCHLGNRPFEVVHLTGFEKLQTTLDGQAKHLTFRAMVRWTGEPEIFFTLSKVKLGVKNITFEGVATVECVAMMPRPLFFQGMRMFFINNPVFDMDFEGQFTSVLNMSTIKSMIIDAVVEQFAKRAVVPNRVAKPLMSDADWFDIARPLPDGILEVVVHSCANLIATDINFVRANSSDPYVTIFCGAHKFKSPVIKKDLNPKFNFVVRLQVVDVHSQKIAFELKDHDQISKDDFLGKLEVVVASAIEWGIEKVSFPLGDEGGVTGNNGSMCLSADWRPILRQMQVEDGVGRTGFLFVGVYGFSHVPQMAEGTKFWVVVNCDGAWDGNGGKPAVQMTEKLSQHGAHWLAKDKAAQMKIFKEKLELLRNYKVSSKDIAHILEIDPSQIEAATDSNLLGTSELLFNAGFDYIIDKINRSFVTISFKCQEPAATTSKSIRKTTSVGQERSLGTCTIGLSELLQEPFYRRTLELPGTSILLKVVLELRFLGRSPKYASDSVKEA